MAEPTSNLAPLFGNYVTDYLSKAQGLANTEFQPYTGDLFAGPSQLQQQAFSGIGSLTGSPYFDQAAGVMGQAAGMATQGSGYTPTTFNAPGYTAAQIGNNGGFGYDPTSYSAAQMTAPGGIGNLLDASNTATVQSFMNPYTQSVTDIAKREAQNTFNIQALDRQAAAQRAGAYGGSRHGILDGMATKDLAQQLNDLQMKGGDAAFRSAIDALNSQRATDLQRQQFNQNMQYNTGLQNMQALNQAGQFNAGAANQAAQFGAGQGLTASQFNANAANQAGQFNAQQGLTAQQLSDASRQFGAQNYNQGIQSLLQAGTGLANVGTAQTTNDINRLNQMLGAGAIQQSFDQKPLDFGYEQWKQSLQFPYQQLQFQQGMLQGLPLSVNQTQAPNALLEGLMGAGGIYNLLFGD